jgi:hypothetical protein
MGKLKHALRHAFGWAMVLVDAEKQTPCGSDRREMQGQLQAQRQGQPQMQRQGQTQVLRLRCASLRMTAFMVGDGKTTTDPSLPHPTDNDLSAGTP